MMDAWLGLKAKPSADIEPPSKKWKPSYEQNRIKLASRETAAKWLVKYKWLKEVGDSKQAPLENGQTLFCTWCKKAGKINSFSSGRTCFKADVLNKHERTEDHRFAMLGANRESVSAAAAFQKAVCSAKAKSEQSVIEAMKIIHFQAKECIATRKFKPLLELCKEFAPDSLGHLDGAKNASHDSYGSIHEMEAAICHVIEKDIIDKIKNSRWYSVLLDESTDVSSTQSVIVYIKLVNKGVLHSHFLQLKALPGCTSAQIFEAVLQVLKKFGVKYENISGLGTDGASNMVGCKKGVLSLFKQKSDTVIGIHCSAHRLALASGQAADSVLYLVKFQDILNRIYKYFHFSPKHTHFLEEIQSILGVNGKKFVQTFSTRWLSFYKSVSIVLDHWAELVSVLINDKGAVAQGLLKCITNIKFLATAAYLCDVLFVLNDLCYTFLKSTVDFNTCNLKIDCCVNELKEIFNNETGTRFMEFFDNVPKSPDSLGNFQFMGHTVRDSDKLRSESATARKAFMASLLENLDERFENLPQLQMFEFLLPVNVPSEGDCDFTAYGMNEMKRLCVFFANHSDLCDQETMLNEWKLFRRVLSTRCKNMNLIDCIKFFYSNDIVEVFPIMTSLYEFVATLPLSTADCERGFSLMNITKTDLRNRLSIENLSNLMMINLEGSIRAEFPFKDAFANWCMTKPRRVYEP